MATIQDVIFSGSIISWQGIRLPSSASQTNLLRHVADARSHVPMTLAEAEP